MNARIAVNAIPRSMAIKLSKKLFFITPNIEANDPSTIVVNVAFAKL